MKDMDFGNYGCGIRFLRVRVLGVRFGGSRVREHGHVRRALAFCGDRDQGLEVMD